MIDLKFVPIRERDRHGDLRAGGTWQEPRGPWYLLPTLSGIAGLTVTGVICLMAAGTGLSVATAILCGFGLVIGAISIAALALGRALRSRPREIVFEANGAISAQYGFPGYEGRKTVGGNHRQIMSIETKGTKNYGYTARMISTDGDTVSVSHQLDESDALKVVVQLTRALTELRQSQANAGARATGPQRGFSGAPASGALID